MTAKENPRLQSGHGFKLGQIIRVGNIFAEVVEIRADHLTFKRLPWRQQPWQWVKWASKKLIGK